MQYQFQKIQYCTCVYICMTKNPVSICRTALWPYENNVHAYAYMYIHAYTNSMPYNDTYVMIIMYTYIIALFLKKISGFKRSLFRQFNNQCNRHLLAWTGYKLFCGKSSLSVIYSHKHSLTLSTKNAKLETKFYFRFRAAELNPLTANDALPNYPWNAEAVNAVT